jgi:Leu/Phe-tRNA-protein transferase
VSFLVEKMIEVKHDNSHLVTIPVDTPQDKLLKLKGLFEMNQGNDEISLFFEKDNRKILAKQKVKWNVELQEEIKKILK